MNECACMNGVGQLHTAQPIAMAPFRTSSQFATRIAFGKRAASASLGEFAMLGDNIVAIHFRLRARPGSPEARRHLRRAGRHREMSAVARHPARWTKALGNGPPRSALAVRHAPRRGDTTGSTDPPLTPAPTASAQKTSAPRGHPRGRPISRNDAVTPWRGSRGTS